MPLILQCSKALDQSRWFAKYVHCSNLSCILSAVSAMRHRLASGKSDWDTSNYAASVVFSAPQYYRAENKAHLTCLAYEITLSPCYGAGFGQSAESRVNEWQYQLAAVQI